MASSQLLHRQGKSAGWRTDRRLRRGGLPARDAIETILEQRAIESSLSNYNGWIDVVPRPISETEWELEMTLRSVSELGKDADKQPVYTGRIVVIGGDDREAVLFGISIVSKSYSPSPPLLSISTPCIGRSEVATIFLQAEADSSGDPTHRPKESAVVVEVSQGTKTLMALRVRLEEG